METQGARSLFCLHYIITAVNSRGHTATGLCVFVLSFRRKGLVEALNFYFAIFILLTMY